jgi:hypothetical protein
MSYYQYYHDTLVHGYGPQKLELPFLQNISMSCICLNICLFVYFVWLFWVASM